MVYYLIICRSLTYAQRTAGVLERAGISTHILRSPKSITGEGCGHAVKVAQRHLAQALILLNRAQIAPLRVYLSVGDGSYQEAQL